MRRFPFRLLFLGAAAAAAWVWYRSARGDAPEPDAPRGPEPDPRPEPDPEPVDEVPREVHDEVPEAVDEPAPAAAPRAVEEPVLEQPAGGASQTTSPDDALLAFVNRATDEELSAVGITPGARRVILDLRPFGSVESLAGTRGIGPKTLEALRAAC